MLEAKNITFAEIRNRLSDHYERDFHVSLMGLYEKDNVPRDLHQFVIYIFKHLFKQPEHYSTFLNLRTERQDPVFSKNCYRDALTFLAEDETKRDEFYDAVESVLKRFPIEGYDYIDWDKLSTTLSFGKLYTLAKKQENKFTLIRMAEQVIQQGIAILNDKNEDQRHELFYDILKFHVSNANLVEDGLLQSICSDNDFFKLLKNNNSKLRPSADIIASLVRKGILQESDFAKTLFLQAMRYASFAESHRLYSTYQINLSKEEASDLLRLAYHPFLDLRASRQFKTREVDGATLVKDILASQTQLTLWALVHADSEEQAEINRLVATLQDHHSKFLKAKETDFDQAHKQYVKDCQQTLNEHRDRIFANSYLMRYAVNTLILVSVLGTLVLLAKVAYTYAQYGQVQGFWNPESTHLINVADKNLSAHEQVPRYIPTLS